MFENLDKQIKAEWVEALRDGGYHQGQGMLKWVDQIANTAEHCCLGVLCETLGLGETTSESGNQRFSAYAWLAERDEFFGAEDSGHFENTHSLPVALSYYLGITEGELEALITLNDGVKTLDTHLSGRQYSFVEIANLIETGEFDDYDN